MADEAKRQVAAMQSQLSRLQDENKQLRARVSRSNGKVLKRRHPLNVMTHAVADDGTPHRVRMGRTASIGTSTVIAQTPVTREEPLAHRLVAVFRNPLDHVTYLQSTEFASDLLEVAELVKPLLEREPRVLSLQSPCYVFGDIHGNIEDLHFFADNIWKLGVQLTAGKFLFLGDYVDRGLSGLECVGYLFALKLLSPRKVFLLRGNHELRDVNGWESHYAERSFLRQCKDRFGHDLGTNVWEGVNQVFDRLPLAAVIDRDIFCVHGGIPRPLPPEDLAAAQRSASAPPSPGYAIQLLGRQRSLSQASASEASPAAGTPPEAPRGRSRASPRLNHRGATRMGAVLAVPSVAGVAPTYPHESAVAQRVASDCLWSDPASEVQEAELDAGGFGASVRGGGAICFGSKAVDDFLRETGYSYIIRAHEAHAEGVALCKGARVFTVFSTSKDHGQGNHAMAGCILVDCEEIQVINRSPAYRNRFVHRRDSVSLADMDADLIEEGVHLGLVMEDEEEDAYMLDDSDEEDEPYEDDDTAEEPMDAATPAAGQGIALRGLAWAADEDPGAAEDDAWAPKRSRTAAMGDDAALATPHVNRTRGTRGAVGSAGSQGSDGSSAAASPPEYRSW